MLLGGDELEPRIKRGWQTGLFQIMYQQAFNREEKIHFSQYIQHCT